jgi:hypothetical protein
VPPFPDIHPGLKGHPVFVLVAVLALVALASVVAVVLDVQSDGYRRLPERKFVRSF